MGFHLDRDRLLKLACVFVNDPDLFHRHVESCRSERGFEGASVAVRELVIVREWGRHGAQSVELPHTYAAALMATDPYGAIDDEALPWPCFEIIVPEGLLHSSHGPVFSLLVCTPPPDLKFVHSVDGVHATKLMLCYHDSASGGVLNMRGIDWLCKEHCAISERRLLDEGLEELFDPSLETRLWAMLQRLAANVIIAINTKRKDKPEAYPSRPMREKHGNPKANLHRLGAPLKIDFRNHISEFVTGIKRSAPSTTTLVRGHYRHQAYGPKWSQHRWIRIEPFLKGSGPMIPRPIKLIPPDEGNGARATVEAEPT